MVEVINSSELSIFLHTEFQLTLEKADKLLFEATTMADEFSVDERIAKNLKAR
jgi:hypothetical protein